MFDKLIKNIEREIEELKTARQRTTAATSTIAREITCQSKATMNSSHIIVADTYAKITITPDGADDGNSFLFTASQEGVQGDGTSSFIYTAGLSEDGKDYILTISIRSYNGAWSVNEQKTITHNVRIIATNTFTYTVEEVQA